MGFDPTLGLMHTDKRYRPSLSSDLMESVRPVADRIAVELLRVESSAPARLLRLPRAFAGCGRRTGEGAGPVRGRIAGGG